MIAFSLTQMITHYHDSICGAPYRRLTGIERSNFGDHRGGIHDAKTGKTRPADPFLAADSGRAGPHPAADNPENAEAFVRFLLSKVAQQYFAGSTFEYPLVEEVRPSVLLTPLEEIGQPDITLADLGDLAGTQAMLQEVGALP